MAVCPPSIHPSSLPISPLPEIHCPLFLLRKEQASLISPLLEYFIIVVKYRLIALYYMGNGIILCESG